MNKGDAAWAVSPLLHSVRDRERPGQERPGREKDEQDTGLENESDLVMDIYGFTVYMGIGPDGRRIRSISKIRETPPLLLSRRGSYEVGSQRRDFFRYVYLFAG